MPSKPPFSEIYLTKLLVNSVLFIAYREVQMIVPGRGCIGVIPLPITRYHVFKDSSVGNYVYVFLTIVSPCTCNNTNALPSPRLSNPNVNIALISPLIRAYLDRPACLLALLLHRRL